MPTCDPTDIFEASPTELGITWKDGHRTVLSIHRLRVHCPCASCNDLRGKFGELKIDKDTIRVSQIAPVGRYALNIVFSDGHSTGLYGWEFLRNLCLCPQCRPTMLTGQSGGGA